MDKVLIEVFLAAFRYERDLSLSTLAKLSGVSKSEIQRIENGKRIPRIDTLCMLADALGVKPEELYRYTKS